METVSNNLGGGREICAFKLYAGDINFVRFFRKSSFDMSLIEHKNLLSINTFIECYLVVFARKAIYFRINL